MASKLEGFTFGFDHGTEERGKFEADNVLWHHREWCVAVLHENGKYAVDIGQGSGRDGVFALVKRVWFVEFDPVTARCIAIEWLKTYTHGGNKQDD